MFPNIPSRSHKGCEQSSGKYSPRLERVDAEDFRNVGGVVSPLVDHVKDFCAQNAAEHDENSQVPRVFAVVSEALRIADADPEAQQDA